ncbi:UDP-glycosyltransferase [Quillaja saponaria]|uniref:Glycosyltransferase n=1 Tax=Quillaja saponaria TaxID=32244 RepID=A0AAD7LMY2_QUISA|nr:UDP-glycosyltransferase [Quillaja saponaria]WEU75104.1 UGT91AQ1 [Quillaja saponaria]
MAAAAPNHRLHIAFFPWLAFGHINPFFELAKLIAQKGHHISFISTPRNIQRLSQVPPQLADSIDLVSLPVIHNSNLPENAESTMDIPPDKTPYLGMLHDSLKEPLTQFLQTHSPDWILYDFSAGWLAAIVEDLGISHGYFSIIPCWNIGFNGRQMNGFQKPDISLPSAVSLKKYEVKKIMDLVKSFPKILDESATKSIASHSTCEVIFIRNCPEIEADWFDYTSKIFDKPVVPVGVVPPSVHITNKEKDEHFNKWLEIKEWLDQQDRGSVIYIAFGTESLPNQDEITMLAQGLELCGLPFFWALRKSNVASDQPNSDSVELPEGFEEQTKGRGIVWTSWAPQQRILGHNSIGGFVTHCGWSSVIEGIHYGRPLIMFPLTVEQSLNARILGEKKLGMEVPREDDGSFTGEVVAETLKLVLLDQDGKVYRDKVTEMSKVFGDKDKHEKYMGDLLEFFKNYRSLKRN